MHGKEALIAPVLYDRLGMVVVTATGLDTYVLGTFSGEVPRVGTMHKTAIAKTRLGITAAGLRIGIASEGSYGPHPHIPFLAGGVKLTVLVDDSRDIVVTEYMVEGAPAYHHAFARTIDELKHFLARIRFPEHAVIVRSAEDGVSAGMIRKGLRRKDELASAMLVSSDSGN